MDRLFYINVLLSAVGLVQCGSVAPKKISASDREQSLMWIDMSLSVDGNQAGHRLNYTYENPCKLTENKGFQVYAGSSLDDDLGFSMDAPEVTEKNLDRTTPVDLVFSGDKVRDSVSVSLRKQIDGDTYLLDTMETTCTFAVARESARVLRAKLDCKGLDKREYLSEGHDVVVEFSCTYR